MINNHVCYMECGSIINSYTGAIIEEPALFVGKDDILHGWGNMDTVQAKFDKYTYAYAKAGMKEELDELMLIELSQYKITREMACYVIRRAVEITASGFISELCRQVTEGSDPVAWLESEMKHFPIDLEEKEWGNKKW